MDRDVSSLDSGQVEKLVQLSGEGLTTEQIGIRLSQPTNVVREQLARLAIIAKESKKAGRMDLARKRS